jgi:hypothetical protein
MRPDVASWYVTRQTVFLPDRLNLFQFQRGRKIMEQERMNEIAEQLEAKAESVADGFYGADDDNESWAADLRHGAKHLRDNEIAEISIGQWEEIEAGSDIDGTELLELKRIQYEVEDAP